MSTLRTLDRLLRSPLSLLDDDQTSVSDRARHLLAIIVAGCGVFGAVLGIYHGHQQVVFAALKLPAVLILTTGLVTPTVLATRWFTTGAVDLHRNLLCVLIALARTSTLCAALTPVLGLGILYEVGYSNLALIMTGLLGLAALGGLRLFVRTLGGSDHRLVTTVLIVTFMVIGSQSAWVLRPWLVHPTATETEFVRTVEGDLWSSLSRTVENVLLRNGRGRAASRGDISSSDFEQEPASERHTPMEAASPPPAARPDLAPLAPNRSVPRPAQSMREHQR